MRYLLCLVLLAVTCVAPVGAQTVDTVMLGTVVDPGSAPVAGVTVTVTQPSTGLSHTATTSPEGAYEIRYLYPVSTSWRSMPQDSAENGALEW